MGDSASSLRPLQLEYFKMLEELADGRYDTRADFTVVLQPHLRDQDMFRLVGSVDDGIMKR